MAGDEEGSTTQGASACGAGGGGAQLATGGFDLAGAGAWGGLRGSFPLAWGVPELPSRHGGAREPETPTSSGWASREQGPTLPLPLRSRNGGIRLCCAPAGAAGGDASPVANWFYWAAEGRFHRVLAAGRPSHPLPPRVFVPFRRRWEPLGGPGELAGGRRWSPFPQPPSPAVAAFPPWLCGDLAVPRSVPLTSTRPVAVSLGRGAVTWLAATGVPLRGPCGNPVSLPGPWSLLLPLWQVPVGGCCPQDTSQGGRSPPWVL